MLFIHDQNVRLALSEDFHNALCAQDDILDDWDQITDDAWYTYLMM